MSTKEKIKKELDTLPDEILNQVYEFLHLLKSGKKKRHPIKSFRLKGQFDNINIRKIAYE